MPVSVVCDTAAVTAAIRESIATSSGSAVNSCSASANDDAQTIQSKLVASAKRVLLSKIEYEEVNSYSQSVLDTLKSKYIVLKPSSSAKSNHSSSSTTTVTNGTADKDANQNQCNASTNGPKPINQLPQPKRILYPRENVQIGWKGAGRKWQVGAGMINVGNTCYLNSTLQALLHVPAMTNWLMSDAAHREKCEDENGAQGGCIICAMSKTLIFSQNNQNPIRPYLVYTKLRLVCKHLIMGRQEDAHEFLRYLVEAMEKSYLARYRNGKELDQYSKETTPLNQILGGYLKSAVRCLSCGHVSVTFQHFQDLLLDIRKANTLEEALDGYFARERLEDMGYKCEACKKKVTATKQFSLERAPISLCIQLKRFSMMGSKLNKHVAIRPRLDLSPYASKTNREQLNYKLVAMVTHLGPSQHCGHYTAIGLTESGAYYQFDDSSVRPISLQNVLNTNAYIIFYELDDNHDHGRQTSTQISRDHANNSLKELSNNKVDCKSTNTGNGLQRQNSTSNSATPTIIGPQLPSKLLLQQRNSSTLSNGPATTNGDHSKNPRTQSPNNSKLVNSQSPFKGSNGNASNSASSSGSFASPPLSHKSNYSNSNLSSKVTIHFKNNSPNTSTNSNNNSNSNKSSQSSNGTKFLSNGDKTSNGYRSSTLPNMPKLDETAKTKQLPRSGEQTPTKTNTLSNGFLKSPPSTSGFASKTSNNLKSLVPYESDDDSDQSNDEKSKAKDCRTTVEASKSGKKRSYDSDSSSEATPPPPKIRPTTPIIKTKAGLWQVTDIENPKSNISRNGKVNGDCWKNPFSSASPTVSNNATSSTTRSYDVNNSSHTNKFSEKDKKFANKKNPETQQQQNGTVQHLLKFSNRGYGAPVLSWSGQRAAIEKEVIEEIRQERKRDLDDEDENEMDRGRQKKIKTQHNGGFAGRDNPGYNPFQEHQNHQNQQQHRRWNNGGSYRPYRPNHYHRNHNYRRHHFHKRPHHQRNGGGSGNFHHRRDS